MLEGAIAGKEYSEINFPRSRIGTFDVGVLGRKKHHVLTLLELDVTDARKEIRKQRQRERISFTGWMLKTIADTLMSHKEMCAYLKGKTKKVVFDDISITLAVEKSVNGNLVPLPLLLEKVQLKTPAQITALIEDAHRLCIEGEDQAVIGKKTSRWAMKLYYFLPGFLRLRIMSAIINNPRKAKKTMGNVMFTSLAGLGKAAGWIIPKSYHNLCFALGSVVKKPWVVKDQIVIREIAHLTILINHDVVDGAPMARFVSDLSRRMERGEKEPKDHFGSITDTGHREQ